MSSKTVEKPIPTFEGSVEQFLIGYGQGADLKEPKFEVLSTIRYDPNLGQSDSGKRNNNGPSEVRNNGKIELNFDPKTGSDFIELFLSDTTPSRRYISIGDSCKRPPSWKYVSSLSPYYKLFYERFFLLDFHYIRINAAIAAFGWNYHITIEDLLAALIHALQEGMEYDTIQEELDYLLSRKDIYKMRVLASLGGKFKVEAHLLSQSNDDTNNDSTQEYFQHTLLRGLKSNVNNWDVFINNEFINVSLFTYLKTTKREHYTKARNLMSELSKSYNKDLPTTKKSEILVYNKSNELMEGSITNVAVWSEKEGTYVTPKASSGCLRGTMRKYLLQAGHIKEGHIHIDSLYDGEEILLFNGIMGCVKGTIRKFSTQTV
ncbi:aminodeoxychorismate lyase ABZ2 NDAI_0C03580 [Naumovozyma dairenensis CBS 421]|uniref:Aminodeoxychorismate lyase n=1 Tax=Naumovozyma dairenensis (strain ATCC 10597 / BCRC 20456 / CBS 421 / NBRC 0211 / NRRL Y-12639) TaxID=1071378 RepID=G0W8A7_NAUDC|nr:hypothetical protein NDAI_0C03580 [Naumovozyma dairenensis CBS 421]CCD24018.1 hypothetical protein NDAI_0C03580 [Naumovozyma dairenensis CBS 421]